MKAVNFWKTLFCAALAVTAFTACSDDDDDGYKGMAEISVNGGESVTVSRDLTAGETSPVVEVVSKGDWTLKFENESDASWCTPTLLKGKTGTTKLSFNLSAASADRTATIKLTATGYFEGVPIPKKATIKVVQSSGSIPTDDPLYSENCGTKVEKVDDYWPYVDKFEGWTRGGSLDQKAVAYAGSYSSVANSGKTFDPTEDEKQDVSGAPYVSMNKSTSVFDIKGINIASNTNFTFTFTAIQQVNYSNGVVLGDVTDETIRFSVSTDGENYSPVALKVSKIGTGYWYLATAEFKLPAGVSVDKISVRFDGYAGLVNHGLRIDDFKLYEGGNGAELGGDTPSEDYKKVTIDQITAAGKYALDGTTIVGVHSKGVLFAQNNSGSVNYILGFNNAWMTQTSNPYINDVDKTAGVKGTVEQRSGLFQFSDFSVTTGAASSLQLPTPVVFDAAGLDAYIAATGVYKYVKITGTLGIKAETSYNTYSLNVSGFDSKEIRLAYGLDSYFANFKAGDVVDVTGFALGYDTYKINVLLRTISKNSSTPAVDITTDPATFAAASPAAQTLSYTFANTTAAEVTFSLEGTNADKFSLGTKTDNTIVVNAVGDNTSDAAYTAQLVAKVAGATLASVELKQASSNTKNYVPVTTAPADWSGAYVVGYPNDKTCNIINGKFKEQANTTFTNLKLEEPEFDGTNIVYNADYKTIQIAKIAGTEFYSMQYGSEYVGWEKNTGNNCQFTETVPTADSKSYQWAITLDNDGFVVMTCQFKDGDSDRVFNYNATSPRFAIYKTSSKQAFVKFYKL